jgi:WD40 repeat protein
MGCGSSISVGQETEPSRSTKPSSASPQMTRHVAPAAVDGTPAFATPDREPAAKETPHQTQMNPPSHPTAEVGEVLVGVVDPIIDSPPVQREPSASNHSPEHPFASVSEGEFEAQFDKVSDHFERSGSAPSVNSQFLDVGAADSSPKGRYRSKSVARLEKISRTRQQEQIDDKPFEDFVVVSQDSFSFSVKKDDMSASTVVRTRRLSSIYNEFATSVDAFLKANGDRDDNETSSQSESGGVDESSLRKIFNLLDQRQTGEVSQDSLVEGFKRMGHTKTIATLTTYFECADSNHDGLLQWDEFSKFFRYLTGTDFVSADDADIDTLPPPRPRTRNYSTILVSMRTYRSEPLPSQAGRIKCTALSEHRKMYAVSHRNDKNVNLYNFDGSRMRVLSGHSDSLLGIAFSSDRKIVASVSRDCMLILWDCTVGHAVNTVQHPGIVTAVCFSHDGKNIYTGCQDNLVRRFSGSKCHLKAVLDHLPRAELGVTVALACQHHANKQIVFSRSCDRGAIVADANTLRITTVLEGHKSMVWQAHFRADGTKLLTSCEKFVKVWSTDVYAPLFVLDSECFVTEKGIARNSKPKLWTTASFCPPRYGPMIVVFNTDTNMMFVDSDTGKLILSHNFKSSIYSATVSLDSAIIICGDDWGNMYKFTLL